MDWFKAIRSAPRTVRIQVISAYMQCHNILLPIKSSGVFLLSRGRWSTFNRFLGTIWSDDILIDPRKAGFCQGHSKQLSNTSGRGQNFYRCRKARQTRICKCSQPQQVPLVRTPWQEARSKSLENLGALKKRLGALESELAAYGDCDPAKIEETKRAVFLAKEASLRWTGKLNTQTFAVWELTNEDGLCQRQLWNVASLFHSAELRGTCRDTEIFGHRWSVRGHMLSVSVSIDRNPIKYYSSRRMDGLVQQNGATSE